MIDWTRIEEDGERTNVTSTGQTFVKLGLDQWSDVELGVTPYIRQSDAHGSASGFGDVTVRYKRRLSAEDSRLQAGVIPFVKLPAAKRSIGNGRLEGGIILPVSLSPRAGPTITLGPEVDLLADEDGHGYHSALANLVNLGLGISNSLSVSTELWNSMDFDPHGTVRQWSLDGSAAYLASSRLQIDAGANFGLNRATPGIELYGGISALF